MRQRPPIARATAAAAILGLALTGCAQTEEADSTGNATADATTCTKDQLTTLKDGMLTVATGEPAYPPWVVDDAPQTQQGFESAVAYAAAERLGFADSDVVWTRTTFDTAVAPGEKTFDWNLQQYTITPERQQAVDFSSPYYEASQSVITAAGSSIETATSLADLKDAKLGAAVGSTSLDDAEQIIDPTTPVAVFNDNAAAVSALQNGQIDGIVIDTPSAFYLVSEEIDGGKIVGQLPDTASGESDAFGILLAKGSPLTACTSWAVDQLRDDGTLADLEATWLEAGGAPVLK